MTKIISVPHKIQKEILKRDKYKCQKCGFIGATEDLEIHHIKMKVNEGTHSYNNSIVLCSICHYFAPTSDEEFKIYLNEKIDGTVLDTFRKSQKSISKRTKKGMIKIFKTGQLVTRAPLGYKVENKQLIPTENSYIVQEIFQEFLNTNTSLTQLAKKHSLSVNGLKKILTNYTYLGKIKFAGEIKQGIHKPLLSAELFNRVQEKMREKGWID